MSVATISIEEFADVAETIRTDNELRSIFKSFRERYLDHNLFGQTGTTEDDIHAFADRLYIANQLAFQYQYHKSGEITIPRLTEKQLQGRPADHKTLLRLLRGIHYNLATNNGRVFLGQEDYERLERLIDTCKGAIIEDLGVSK